MALRRVEHFLEPEAQGIITDTFPDPPQRLTQVTSVSQVHVSTRPECVLSSGGALRVARRSCLDVTFCCSFHIWSRYDAFVSFSSPPPTILVQVCLRLVCSSCPTGTCALLCRVALSRARCRSWLGITTTTARSAEGGKTGDSSVRGVGVWSPPNLPPSATSPCEDHKDFLHLLPVCAGAVCFSS